MDPLSVYQDGGLLAVAVLLFIANFVQNFGIKKSNETLVKSLEQANTTAAAANQSVAVRLTGMAETLAVGQAKLAEGLAAVIKNQDILATNQMHLSHSSNDVVRELITIIRDGDRS